MHTGYSAASQSYAPQATSRSVLVRTSTVPVRYELRWPDGSVDIFAQPDGGSVYPRKVFLTEKRDAQGNAVTLSYDSSLRIVQGDSSAATFAYAYDAVGNRQQETIGSRSSNATYNNVNQLLSNGSDSYSYDLEGNQNERQSSTLGNRRYLWDAENRLIALEDPANPATRSDFGYDALGRRISLQDQSNGVLTQDLRLVYCGTTLCGKQDNLTGNATRYYGDGESRDGVGFYYHRDHLGSMRAVTDAAGSLKAGYRYDPYGRRTVLSGSAADSDFGYTGHFSHQASGLALAPYRAYDAGIGRWLSRDPIGEQGGVNLYSYVRNNPVNYIDPDGNNPVAIGLALTATLAAYGYYNYHNTMHDYANEVNNARETQNIQDQALSAIMNGTKIPDNFDENAINDAMQRVAKSGAKAAMAGADTPGTSASGSLTTKCPTRKIEK